MYALLLLQGALEPKELASEWQPNLMPELPEVETVVRGLSPVMEGRRIEQVEQRRPDLRFPLPERFAERLKGRRIERLNRRAKYILAHLEGGEILTMHLGMSGRFSIQGQHRATNGVSPLANARTRGAAEEKGLTPIREQLGEFTQDADLARFQHDGLARFQHDGLARFQHDDLARFHHDAGNDPAHDHVVFRMEGGATITYNDARRFGYMSLIGSDEFALHPHFKDLGIEPLGNELTPHFLAGKAEGRKTDLKAFLMDQRIIAGLGNIYVCEALHRSGLSPNRQSSTLARRGAKPTDRAERLVAEIRAVLEAAIAAGGSTLRDYKKADGSLGYFQHAFKVYGREGEPCAKGGCKGNVTRIVQAGRSTFFCPACQR